MSTNTEAVIRAYEKKLSDLEAEKARFADMMLHHRAPDGGFEEKLERLLAFLANPWKIWDNGNVSLRRVVLKLVFADRISYTRNEGARTTNLSLPFKALGMFTHSNFENGASHRRDLEHFIADISGMARTFKRR